MQYLQVMTQQQAGLRGGIIETVYVSGSRWCGYFWVTTKLWTVLANSCKSWKGENTTA